MKIERKSKCLWIINNKIIDTRKKVKNLSFNQSYGLRKAFYHYFETSDQTYINHNSRICNFINRNLQLVRALENQIIFIK